MRIPQNQEQTPFNMGYNNDYDSGNAFRGLAWGLLFAGALWAAIGFAAWLVLR